MTAAAAPAAAAAGWLRKRAIGCPEWAQAVIG